MGVKEAVHSRTFSTLGLLVVTLVAGALSGSWLIELTTRAGRSPAELWTWGVIVAVLAGLAIGWAVFWVRRLGQALRCVRYANV